MQPWNTGSVTLPSASLYLSKVPITTSVGSLSKFNTLRIVSRYDVSSDWGFEAAAAAAGLADALDGAVLPAAADKGTADKRQHNDAAASDASTNS